jgi:hypothetical protein
MARTGESRMGWNVRKSLNLGPFRVNMSKTGLGYSIGNRFFRRGVSANGRPYSRFTIPGTGISYTSSNQNNPAGGKTGCLVPLLVFVATLASILVAWRCGA